MIEFVIKCDVCSAEIQKSNKKIESEKKIFQVIFITEQTEGMSCDPYLSDQKLDVCKSCESEMLTFLLVDREQEATKRNGVSKVENKKPDLIKTIFK